MVPGLYLKALFSSTVCLSQRVGGEEGEAVSLGLCTLARAKCALMNTRVRNCVLRICGWVDANYIFSLILPETRAQPAKCKCGLEDFFLLLLFSKSLHVQILYKTIECTLGELSKQGTLVMDLSPEIHSCLISSFWRKKAQMPAQRRWTTTLSSLEMPKPSSYPDCTNDSARGFCSESGWPGFKFKLCHLLKKWTPNSYLSLWTSVSSFVNWA